MFSLRLSILLPIVRITAALAVIGGLAAVPVYSSIHLSTVRLKCTAEASNRWALTEAISEVARARHEGEYEYLQSELKRLSAMIPHGPRETPLHEQLDEIAKKCGATVDSFQFIPGGDASEGESENIVILQIKMNVHGSNRAVGAFLDELPLNPRMMILDSIKMQAVDPELADDGKPLKPFHPDAIHEVACQVEAHAYFSKIPFVKEVR